MSKTFFQDSCEHANICSCTDLYQVLTKYDQNLVQFENVREIPCELILQNDSIMSDFSKSLQNFLEDFNGYKAPKKRIIVKPTRISKKRIRSRRTQKKTLNQFSDRRNEDEEELYREIQKNFKDKISESDLQKVLQLLKNQETPMVQADPRFRENLMHSLKTYLNYKQNGNINYINTRQPQNFVTYQKEKNGSLFPENCRHVKICYSIWEQQGKKETDPTAVGRKIKKMHLIVSQKEQLRRTKQFQLKTSFI